MSELGKPFLKTNQIKNFFKKKTKNRCQMPHVNKTPLARNENLVHTKTRPKMSY